jgi:putative MATE family efflux protein
MFDSKQLKRLIIPLIIEQILAVTVGMADIIMVSSTGEAAVSGVSLVDMINVLFMNLFAALATGGAVVTSQLIGHGDDKSACESAHQLQIISVILSVAIMLFSVIFCRGILVAVFAVDGEVLDYACKYFYISAASYPFLSIYNSNAALFRSMGNSKVSMYVSLVMNVINISLNAVFVYGFRLGVVGVSLSSLIARLTAAVIMSILIRNQSLKVHIIKGTRLHINKYMIKRILGIGIPNGLENSMFQFGRVIVVRIIAAFGTVQIAANAVANNIDGFGTIPGQAISLAMITVVGQCVGACDYKQARYYVKKLIKIAYIITIILDGLILLTLPLILQAYNLSDETLSLATKLIFIHNGCAMLIWPLSFTLPNALRAANDVKYTMVVAIFSMWMFRIVFSYVLGKWLGWGAIGVWVAMILDWIFRTIMFIARYVSGKWEEK